MQGFHDIKQQPHGFFQGGDSGSSYMMGRTTPGTTKRQPSQAMISNNPNTTCFAQTTRLQESLHVFTISNLHRDDNRNKHTCSDQQNVDFFYFIFLKDTERGFPSLLVGSQHKIQHPHESRDTQQQHRRGGRRRGKEKLTPTLFISQSLWTP